VCSCNCLNLTKGGTQSGEYKARCTKRGQGVIVVVMGKDKRLLLNEVHNTDYDF
jgi:hypothetical protein